MAEHFRVTWVDRGKEPKGPPNPQFPEGVDLDITDGPVPSCKASLPYPAKRVGLYMAECSICGADAGVLTTGLPDDPRSVTLPCRSH